MPSVRILTYNIQGGRQRAALRTVVESVDPDVVVVNESPQLPLWWRWACPSLARDWQLDHVAGGRNAGRNMICAGEYVGLRHTHVERIKQPRWFDPIRGVVSARLQLGGRPFGVVGCHLSLSPKRRPHELEIVLYRADQLDGPVILAGDLSEEPGGPGWHQLAEAGFIDTASGDALTYPSTVPAKRIDALLVRGSDVEVLDHRIPPVPQELLATASDHLPVTATIRWA
ncbi:MAG: hypothetical protein GEU96_14585 [Propionibacteriales bacterium]|nr:hypothetical protein [Propionibacteriales bacterium]